MLVIDPNITILAHREPRHRGYRQQSGSVVAAGLPTRGANTLLQDPFGETPARVTRGLRESPFCRADGVFGKDRREIRK